MAPFIASMIEEAKDVGGIEAGKNKYKAYFGSAKLQKLYGKHEATVDAILTTDGYQDCIVPYVA